MLYDYDLIFPQGDPAPKGGKEEIFAAAKAMYHDMSPGDGKVHRLHAGDRGL